ncbi:caspase family protein [Kribbella sp. NPDC026611]|uniref:caspase, EACC1-associated type n=1 Tax=Kribbella sp. NPDC026611 TaxID=3154911 RepID=UPI0034112119
MARRALLVATYEYEDAGLRQLVTPAYDAEALAEVLADPAIAGFDVEVLINETSSRVGEAIGEFYAAADRDDLTLLYFSGHGLKDDNGRLYLAMKNTRRERLRFTALPTYMVNEAVDESSARQQILILDCCYGGAYGVEQFAKADSGVHTKTELGGRGRIVLTATDSTQYAFEGDSIRGQAAQSVFTRHVVEGLRSGAADLDADGDITADELYRYAYDAVVAEQPNQRPKQFADVQGRTVIAANPHWTMPAQITANLESPLQPLRESALIELGQLLQASNDQVRRAARAKLESLVDDDSRAISETARAYLDAPPPRPQLVATAPPVRRPSGPTFGAAAKASGRRWRHRAHQLRDKLRPGWPIIILTLLAAAAAVTAAALEPTPYSIALAAFLATALVMQFRGAGPAYVAGSVLPGLVSAALLTSWLTSYLPNPVHRMPFGFLIAAEVTWLAAGGVAAVRWRPPKARPRLVLVLVGVVAALLVLIITVYGYRAWPHLLHPALLSILGAELALTGGLLNFGRAFSAGYVLGGFVVWLGLFHRVGGFSSPWLVVVALLVVWLLLGVLSLRPVGMSVALPSWVMAAALLAPAALGGVAMAVVPPAPRAPVALGLALSPDDQFLYAADVGNGRVLKISTTTREQIGDPLPVGVEPSRLLLSPDGRTLYVCNSGSGSISVVDVAAWKVIGQPIAVAPESTDLSLSTATHRLYVLSQKTQTITVIDTETRQTVGGPLASGPSPSDLAVDAKGQRLYVANQDAGTVSVIDTATRMPDRSPIKVGAEPRDLALGPDGALFVIGIRSYAVINTEVKTSRPTAYDVPGDLSEGQPGPDGKTLYVLGYSGRQDSVQVVDVGSHQVVGTLNDDLGVAVRMVVSADGQRIYLGNFFQPGIIVVDAARPKAIGVIELKR